jgi:hypothetical protein
MRFGEYLVAQGRLNEEQLTRSLAEQKRRQVPFGLLAIHSGAMVPDQVQRVLRTQSSRRVWRRFGDLAVELGLLDAESMEALLRSQANSRPRLGELLVDQGLIAGRELAHLLDSFHGTILNPMRGAALA